MQTCFSFFKNLVVLWLFIDTRVLGQFFYGIFLTQLTMFYAAFVRFRYIISLFFEKVVLGRPCTITHYWRKKIKNIFCFKTFLYDCLAYFVNYIPYFYVLLFSLLNKMPNKKLYKAEEAAQWILEETKDISDEVWSSDSDNDGFVLDALRFSNNIANESVSDYEEDIVELIEENGLSEYAESTSEKEIEANTTNVASAIDMNSIDTNPNDVVKGNIEINIENYDVDQDHHRTKKNKNQIDTSIAHPKGNSCVLVSLLCCNELSRAVLQNTFLKNTSRRLVQLWHENNKPTTVNKFTVTHLLLQNHFLVLSSIKISKTVIHGTYQFSSDIYITSVRAAWRFCLLITLPKPYMCSSK